MIKEMLGRDGLKVSRKGGRSNENEIPEEVGDETQNKWKYRP